VAELLFELGTEELPARFVVPALDDIERVFKEQCAALNLPHGPVRRFGTPRRLALLVGGFPEKTQDVTREVQGPSVKAAFDADGKPKVPALKFAESVKLPVESLARVTTPKGEYLVAKVHEAGRPVAELLPEVLSACVRKINFAKSMRWGDVEQSFGRPLHRIVALLDTQVLPVQFSDVKSDRVTRGHRFLSSGLVRLEHARDYEAALEQVSVIADLSKRRALLVERLAAAASKAGGKLIEDEALVDQVVNLVELPCPVVGTFEARHLDLPPEVLVQEMKSHQRYFSVTDAAGKLLPRFIAVSNTPVRDEALSVKGYERVLRARLTDGRFFFDEDRRTRLIDRLPRLHRRTWVATLGSMAEKTDRIRALSVWLAGAVGAQAHLGAIERAATLCKADLETGMVGEFPELQGVMGREYARHDGEPEAVSLAVFEHYLPRGASDGFPTQDPGALIGLADRIDSLCGLFAIGKKPTGAQDQYGLRRAAIASINLVLHRGYRLSLSKLVDESLSLLATKTAEVKRKPTDAPVKEQVLEFLKDRLRPLWAEGSRVDVIDAVLAAGFDDLVSARKRVDALTAYVTRPDFAALAATFKRVANIVEKQAKDVAPGAVDVGRLSHAAEQALAAEVTRVKGLAQAAIAKDDYGTALSHVVPLKPLVDAFFDAVMVMDPDQAVRENRVRLLMEIGGLFGAIADFSRIQSEA
jgi:glycyl-tRNA synthetase beta chain